MSLEYFFYDDFMKKKQNQKKKHTKKTKKHVAKAQTYMEHKNSEDKMPIKV